MSSKDLRAALALLAVCVGCRRERPADPVQDAAFGVWFGDQIQELDEIPFELDRTKQTLGFRLDFGEGTAAPTDVSWELDLPLRPPEPPRISGQPMTQRPKTSPKPERTLRRGTTRVNARARRFEQVLLLEPGDPLGTWNIRVQVGSDPMIDRPFLLYDAEARRRANAGAPSRLR